MALPHCTLCILSHCNALSAAVTSLFWIPSKGTENDIKAVNSKDTAIKIYEEKLVVNIIY